MTSARSARPATSVRRRPRPPTALLAPPRPARDLRPEPTCSCRSGTRASACLRSAAAVAPRGHVTPALTTPVLAHSNDALTTPPAKAWSHPRHQRPAWTGQPRPQTVPRPRQPRGRRRARPARLVAPYPAPVLQRPVTQKDWSLCTEPHAEPHAEPLSTALPCRRRLSGRPDTRGVATTVPKRQHPPLPGPPSPAQHCCPEPRQRGREAEPGPARGEDAPAAGRAAGCHSRL